MLSPSEINLETIMLPMTYFIPMNLKELTINLFHFIYFNVTVDVYKHENALTGDQSTYNNKTNDILKTKLHL